jgi:spore coat polysaccharide biosynthesis protein SpsF
MDNILIVIQARMSSTRLPGKVLLPLLGKPLLTRMMERVINTKYNPMVVIATTIEQEDDIIEKLCIENNWQVFRGDKEDLLDRHYEAAKKYNADIILKIPSDCPLIDPAIIDRVLEFFLVNKENYDYVSNLHPASYPDGNDVEVMTMKALTEAWRNASKKMEREHTTPYFWENPEKFRIGNVLWEKELDYSMSHRWTIDYPKDYNFIKEIFESLYPSNQLFRLEDILNLLEQKPELNKINSELTGVNWYRNHLGELKTIDKSQTKILN